MEYWQQILLEDFNLFTYVLFSVISDTFFISKQNGSKFRSSRTDQLTVPVNKLSEITVIVIYGQPLHLELFINSRKCNHILHINDMRAKSAKFRTFIHNRQTNWNAHYLFLSSFFFESSSYLYNTVRNHIKLEIRSLLHIVKRRPFLFKTSFVQSLRQPISSIK